MKNNDIIKNTDSIYRIIDLTDTRALVIDCKKKSMPKWVDLKLLSSYSLCAEELETLSNINDLDMLSRKTAYERFNVNYFNKSDRNFILLYFQVIKMYFANVNFNEIPEIGFAHKHFSMEYGANYGRNKRKSIEIAYINSGTVKVEFEGKELYAEKGSVLVLFRHLPIHTETVGNELNSHCTVLAEFSDYEFSMVNENTNPELGFLIPFITFPCPETEEIGKMLYKIASDMTYERENKALSSAVEFLSVLKKLDSICRMKTPFTSRAYAVICKKVRTYIEDNLEKNITLAEISYYVGKSPNHISHAFKSENHKTITQYINEQKVKKMKTLMQSSGLSFKKVCELVGLCDETYGYKLFKKYTGITPKEYISITTINSLGH